MNHSQYASQVFEGHIGRDPEFKTVPSGKEVCNFSIAVQPSKDMETLWLDVNCWTPEICKGLEKGNKVIVIGQVKERTYQKKDGTEGRATTITANYLVKIQQEEPVSF